MPKKFTAMLTDINTLKAKNGVVDLSSDEINDEFIKEFVDKIDRLPSETMHNEITEIDLSNNQIRNIEFLPLFIAGFCNSNKLIKLNLSDNQINFSLNLITFAKWLVKSRIKFIDFSYNQIGIVESRTFIAYLLSVDSSSNRDYSIEIIFKDNSISKSLNDFYNSKNNPIDKLSALEKNIPSRVVVLDNAVCIDISGFVKTASQIPKKSRPSNSTWSAIPLETSPLLLEDRQSECPKNFAINNVEIDKKIANSNDKEIEYSKTNKFQGIYGRLVHFLVRRSLLLDLLTHPFAGKPTFSRLSFMVHFLQGAEFVTEKLWPTALLGLLTHDIFSFYHSPEDRYGNTLGKILGGASTNQATWSSHLGDDLAGEYLYWLSVFLFVGAPLTTGLATWMNYRNKSRSTTLGKMLSEHKMQENIWNDTISWLVPFHLFRSSLSSAEFDILWNDQLKMEDRSDLFDSIKNLIERNNLTHFYGLRTVANIADRYALNNLNKSAATQADDQKKLNEDALKILHGESIYGGINTLMRFSYARYLLWSLGQSGNNSRLDRVRDFSLQLMLFWPSFAYLVYAKARFWETLVRKIQGGFQYYLDKRDCEHANKVWTYINQIAEYDCSVCGEWPFVYLGDIYTSQGCLNGLLRQPQSFDTISSGMGQLTLYPDFNIIDLSRQNWSSWSEPEWQSFLNKLQSSNSELQLFNLSTSVFNPIWPDDGKIEDLVNFLSTVSVKKIDLTNQGIGADMVNKLMQGLTPATQYLDLSSAALDDTGALNVIQNLNHTSINTLKLANNQITNYGVGKIVLQSRNSTLTDLDMSGNQINDLSSLNEALPNASLYKLNLSNQDLSNTDFSAFGQAVSKSTLKSLNMGNTNLADAQMVAFAPALATASLESLDVSENSITDLGAVMLVTHSRNATLNDLKLGDNQVQDKGLSTIAPLLPKTNIRNLEIPTNQYTNTGFKDITDVLPNTTIRSFNAADNFLGDEGANDLAQAISAPSSKLEQVNFANNRVTLIGGNKLFSALSTSKIYNVNLSNNQLTDEIAPALSITIHRSFLWYLDVSYNYLTANTTRAIAAALPSSSLKTLDLSGNPIGSNSKILARTLITGIPNETELGDKTLSRDERRAIHQASAQTELSELRLINTQMNNKDARIICEVLPRTKIAIENLAMSQNDIDPRIVDIQNCQTSTATRTQSGGIFEFLHQTYNQLKSTVSSWEFFKRNPFATKAYSASMSESKKTDIPDHLKSSENNNYEIGKNSVSNIFLSEQRTLSPTHLELPALSNNHADQLTLPDASSANTLPTNLLIPMSGMFLISYFLLYLTRQYSSESSISPNAKLKHSEIEFLKICQKNIAQLRQLHAPQKKSRAYQSGLFADRFEFIENTLSVIGKEIQLALNSQQRKPLNQNDLENKLLRVKEHIHELSIQNKSLKNLGIKERRLKQWSTHTGRQVTIIMQHNLFSKKNTQTIIKTEAANQDLENKSNKKTVKFKQAYINESQGFWKKEKTGENEAKKLKHSHSSSDQFYATLMQ